MAPSWPPSATVALALLFGLSLVPVAVAENDESRPYRQGFAIQGGLCSSSTNGCSFLSSYGANKGVSVTLDDLAKADVAFELNWRSGGLTGYLVCHGSCDHDLGGDTSISEISVALYPAWLHADSLAGCHIGATLVCVPPTQGTVYVSWSG